MRITIVFDNNGPQSDADEVVSALETAWGFACVVEAHGRTLLFDTGSDGPMLVRNLRALGFEPTNIEMLVISHEHWDHTGGVDALLDAGARPSVFVPRSFTDAFRSGLATRVPVTEVGGGSPITAGMGTTGELGVAIVEQSLVIDVAGGCVVVTGCAHPGIEEMVRAAAAGRRVVLAVGGFHLKDADAAHCEEVAAALAAIGVERVAPTHCTGELATECLRAVFGERCVRVGVGAVLEID